MEYKRMKLSKEDLGDDNNNTVEEIAGKMSDWLTNKDVRFGSSDIIFLVEYCQLWCHVEPLFFDKESVLLKNYKEAIAKRNKLFGDFVNWNNSSFGIVVADNANQAIQNFLKGDK